MIILLLNSANLPLAKKMITAGTLKSTQIDHRHIIKEALMSNATSIILFHNHPSGKPARASLTSTRRTTQKNVEMNTVHDDEPYGVITVNLGCPLQTDRLAFVDFSFDSHNVLTNFVPFSYN